MATPDLLQAWQPGVFALGRTLVEFLWQGAAIAATYAAARAILTQPRARLLAGHVALLALALAPIWTLLAQFDAPATEDSGAMRVMSAVVAWVEVPTPGDAPTWPYWLVSLWIAGVLGLSLRLWSQWRRLQHLCRDASPLDETWQHRFDALRLRLGVRWRARLRCGTQIAAPMLIGVLRPTILLPASLVARLPVDQLELILLHELAHLRRFDPIFNLIQTGIVTLLFYHPAVHWISRKVREDRELCCDDDVIAQGGDRLRYARVLLTLAEEESEATPATALAASGGALLQRVEHVVQWPVTRESQAQTHAQGLILLGLAALLALVWWMPRRIDAERLLLPEFAFVPTAILTAPLRSLSVADIVPRLSLPTLTLSLVPESLPAPMPEPTQAALVPVAFEPPLAVAVEPTAPLPSAAAPAAQIAAAPASASVLSEQPMPVRRIEPIYPAAARLKGEQGWVALSYRIDDDGRTTGIAIEQGEPAGAFDQAALAALERWRFDPSDADGRTLRVRFDFVLAESRGPTVASDTPESARCRPRTGSRLCQGLRDSTILLSRD